MSTLALEAERSFRKVAGYGALHRLVAALRAHDAAIAAPADLIMEGSHLND